MKQPRQTTVTKHYDGDYGGGNYSTPWFITALFWIFIAIVLIGNLLQ